MNKYIQQLVELSNYDKEIDVFAPKIEAIEAKLILKKDEILEIGKEILLVNEEIEDLKNQIRQTNVQISEFSKKIEDSKAKSSAVKSEKEIRALTVENDLAKEQLKAANEEIDKLERILGAKNDLNAELAQKEVDVAAELQKIEFEANEELLKIDEARSILSSKKNLLINDMNQKVLAFYQKIRKWAGNSAVVPVKKQACYGCYLKLNDKYYAQVISSDDIITCPHCGRILYKEDDEQ